MPITIAGSLVGNTFECFDGFMEEMNGWISFEGTGNFFSIKRPNKLGTIIASMKDGGRIDIGSNLIVSGLTVHALSPGSSVSIGDNNSVNGDIDVVAHETSSIRIGSNCLVAHKCNVSSSDYHKIFDAKTKERINVPRDVVIGDRVWIGANVNVLKGSVIGEDSVVASGSIVTGKFNPGCILGGVPARVVREGVYWEF